MKPVRFHEMFVEYAMHIAGDYESRISNLEKEVKKLKAVIENIRVESEPDITVDGSFSHGYDVDGDVASTPYITGVGDGGGIRLDELDMDELDICNRCNELYIKGTNHGCKADTDKSDEEEVQMQYIGPE